MEISRVGVVGGGTMGAGIVQTLLNRGLEVCFTEVSHQLVEQCLQKINRIFLSYKKKGLISDDEILRKMKTVNGSTDFSVFSDVDLIIEAVPENLDLKRKIFSNLDSITRPHTILATNTSSLSVTEIGAMTQRPKKVIGMHWFNPPHIMKLIEIIPGLETDQETIEVVVRLCTSLMKIPIQVKECAGFLVNRLLGIYVNEALYLVQEGHSPQSVDQAAENLGIPMGPLKLGDMVGWDTIYHANSILHDEYGNRFALPLLLEEIYSSGRLGAKVGQGFYQYEGGRTAENQDVERKDLEVLQIRLLSSMLNEGVRCLDERIASDRDIDVAMKVGAGMPKGPLQWADEIGLDHLFAHLKRFRDQCGERFLPSALLKRRVAAGHLGKSKGIGFYSY